MFKINENYLQLNRNYLFSTISKKIDEFAQVNPNADIIRLGIGDVTKPLPASVIDSIHKSVDEMSKKETFRGYGPEQGYKFLREKIAERSEERRVGKERRSR